ncbi:Protein NRT1/ PTR FAMILY 2.13 [Vigna angularis]|uniref:Protein NRT1/ PTR FAMILY 2.13 n=1 Tax=Phaseolus angularis TaxID=3914 RepID=A0A8T0JSS7_PHAAN|nr:Protein NRT1/ PTR FAMILY 2.13 [Vigna angularis]
MENKPGWRAISYILGYQIVQRIATLGMMGNLMVYLLQFFNLGQVAAANVLATVAGASNLTAVIGACVADAYLGKFKTIVISSFGALVVYALIHFRNGDTNTDSSATTSSSKLHFNGALCSSNEFPTWALHFRQWFAESGHRGNGTMRYSLCDGSSDSSSLPREQKLDLEFWNVKSSHVFVAAYKKRHLKIPVIEDEGLYYDSPVDAKTLLKMPSTQQLRCLNKAALIGDNELDAGGSVKHPWRLCSIHQVEEVKCLIKMLPIWASGILCLIPVVQQGTFPVSQALKMDRHLGANFTLPPATYNVVSLITVIIFLLCFDLFLQPVLAKVTENEEGLTSLQKIVIGDICSVLTMLCAGLVEWRRRDLAISHGAPDGVVPMNAMWLAPQFVFLGLCEILTVVGHTQFYSTESPENMKSIGNSLQFLVMAFSIYVGTLMVNVVNKVTRKHGGIDWLNDDINAGRLDYYYFLLAGFASLNLVYILLCVKCHHYKAVIDNNNLFE